MRISDWSSDVCSSDLAQPLDHLVGLTSNVKIIRPQIACIAACRAAVRAAGKIVRVSVPPDLWQGFSASIWIAVITRYAEATVFGCQPVLVFLPRLQNLVLAHVHPVSGNGLLTLHRRAHVSRVRIVCQTSDIGRVLAPGKRIDRKSTRLNSSH